MDEVRQDVGEIFLYTADAGIPPAQLEALRRRGFLCVRVSSLDAVKRLPAPMPVTQVRHDLILLAAMRAIAGSNYSQQRFGEEMTKAVLSAHPTLPEQLPEAGISIGEEG